MQKQAAVLPILDEEALENLAEEDQELVLAYYEAHQRAPTPEELEDFRAGRDEAAAQRDRILSALETELAKSRSECIEARELSGIEADWELDELYYEGMDESALGADNWRTKPPGRANLSEEGGDETPSGSAIFLNITRPYCDATSARIQDMLLPTDDKGWAIRPTPVPGMAELARGKVPASVKKQIVEGAAGDTAAAQQRLDQIVAEAKEMQELAKGRAEKAEKRIEDWHIEGQYHAEIRQVIDDVSRVGSGVIKGPVPERQLQTAFLGGTLVVDSAIRPASRRISYWNFFPDKGCGQNIHAGSCTWERDDITEKQLDELRELPGYMADRIDAALKEGPHKADKVFDAGKNRNGLVKRADTDELYEIWYFYGRVSREAMVAAGIPDEKLPKGRQKIDAEVTMVNNQVIKAILNPLDTGEFPYDLMVMQRRADMPWGIGIAGMIRIPQRMVNAAARNMMTNAGVAGGPQLVIKGGLIEPENGRWEIAPLKVWVAGEEADLEHLDNAFRFVKVDMVQAELQNIIMLGLKMAEDVTGLPMILQGQMGQKAPDTLGGMTMLQNNASSVLRRIAKLFDDLVTTPQVRRAYRYLLQYGEDDEEKGDFQIDARGSSALFERDQQNQNILQWAQTVRDPVFGLDPKQWAEQALQAQRLDPKKFQFKDDQWQKIVEQMSQGEQDPRLAVAQLRGEFDARLKTMDQQFESLENEKDRQLTLVVEAMHAEIEQARMVGAREVNWDSLKQRLTDTVIKVRSQERLAGFKGALPAPEVATPAAEPPGRAQDGHAFQQ